MKDVFMWNPVYRLVFSLKEKYIAENHIRFEDMIYEDGCVENWAENVSNDIYKKILEPLTLNYYNGLVSIKYSSIFYENMVVNGEMIFWDVYNQFYRECRTVVFDLKNDNLVACGFRKFRNVNESMEDSLQNLIQRIKMHNGRFEVSEKKDGSMQYATYYNDNVFMCGSSALDDNKSWRLTDGRKMMQSSSGIVEMVKDYPWHTFIFEYISVADAHVVHYKKSEEGLYLIGIRDKASGALAEYCDVVNIAHRYGIKTIKMYDKTIDDVLNDMHTESSMDLEGYVIRVGDYMCKIKTDDYLEMFKAIGSLSINPVIKSIADGVWDDFYAKVPVIKKEFVLNSFVEIKNILSTLDNRIKMYYNEAVENSGNDKKSFMLYVSSSVPKKYRGYVINMFNGVENNYLKKRGSGYLKIAEIRELCKE